MELWTLFASFFKIGAFSFGGGYAMIPLIQQEIVTRNGFLTLQQFLDVVAIAEMTPGPIAVNSATFVGYRVAGVVGSVVSTLGVVLPSFILILIIASFFVRWQALPVVQAVFSGVRPVVIALIALAAVAVGKVSLLEYKSGIIALAVLVLMTRTKLHPVLIIFGAGLLGIIFYI